jgi:two-component system response regulator MprA
MKAPMDCNLVMVVEDDEAIRECVREILEGEGYRVQTAAEGRDALAKLRAGAARPFVILLDLRMPGMDGGAFRDAQATDPALGDIPVVVLSADTNSDEKATALRAAGHLKKPLSLDALLHVVASHARLGHARFALATVSRGPAHWAPGASSQRIGAAGHFLRDGDVVQSFAYNEGVRSMELARLDARDRRGGLREQSLDGRRVRSRR